MASSDNKWNGLLDFRELLEIIESKYELMGPGLSDALTEDEEFDEERLTQIGDTLLVFIGREIRDMFESEDDHHLITVDGVEDAIAAMEKAKWDLDCTIEALRQARKIAAKTTSAREVLLKQQERADAAKRRAQENHDAGE